MKYIASVGQVTASHITVGENKRFMEATTHKAHLQARQTVLCTGYDFRALKMSAMFLRTEIPIKRSKDVKLIMIRRC